MKLSAEKIDLRLRHTFTIARGSRDTVPVVIVKVEQDGVTGYGEASPSTRYGEDARTVQTFLGGFRLPEHLRADGIPVLIDEIHTMGGDDFSAKAALDIALHDWAAKSAGVPLWKYLALPAPRPLTTSFTIGIDTAESVRQKVLEADAYGILKIKAGVEGDVNLVRAVREATDKPLRIDANEGWKTREEALGKISELQELGVELIEQPMPSAMLAETAWLRSRVSLPLIADESFRREEDLPHLGDAFDGINIKLMKCGGLEPARRIALHAQRRGLKIMLGCMIETSVGISAAAQLTGLADYADLDGNMLIMNDPFRGVTVTGGSLHPAPGTGLAVTPAHQHH